MAKKVILTIDDEEHILDLLEYNLEKGGYDVLRAETGEKGLAIMKTMQVDLVLLDYMLPGIDGIEVLKTMRVRPGAYRYARHYADGQGRGDRQGAGP